MRSEKDKMIAGDLYIAGTPQLRAESQRSREMLKIFNRTLDKQKRSELLQQLLGHVENDIYIEPPFRVDYGSNVSIGKGFYANYEMIILDEAPITIGDNVFFGPRTSLYSAGHPIDALIRNEQLEYGKPITIGNDVWFGGNVVVNPGVTIGNNVVIGSGSVVVKNIPDNSIAAGNPCKVIRPISVQDQKFWQTKRDQYYAEKEQE